jgi:peptide/nickel transport system permease protein
LIRARLIAITIWLVFLAGAGPLIAPHSPFETVGAPYQPPSWSHFLGTDGLGRDILSQILSGSRTTLLVSISSAMISLTLGVLMGLASSYRGWVSQALSSLIDVFIIVPPLLVMIFIAAVMGASLYSEVIAISISYWPQTAKTVRAEALSILERPYVEMSRSLGGSTLWILKRHVIPNMGHVVLANLAYLAAVSMVSESVISFLGLGDQRYYSWGMVFYYAFTQGAIYYGMWQWILVPALLIAITAYILFESSREILSPSKS